MGVVATPDPYLTTVDHSVGSIIHSSKLAILNAAVYPCSISRFIWLTRLTTGTITPLDMFNYTLGSTVAIGRNPVGIWYDGRILWVISAAGAVFSSDMETGTTIESFSLPASTYAGLTGGSRYLWTIDVTNNLIQQIDRVTATIIGGFTRPSNSVDLHYDGRFMWVLTGASGTTGTIKQYDPVTGTQIDSFNTRAYAGTESSTGLTGDGRFLYFTERHL